MTQTTQPGAAGQLFREARLSDALDAANASVRQRPNDLVRRVLLAELLLFAGNLERADVVLDACAELDPTATVVVAEFRQLLRAEVSRSQLFRDGRAPEFLGEPTATQRAALAALVALRAGDFAEAGRFAAEAEATRAHPSGSMEGYDGFDDLRDGDDFLAGTFEVLTTTGKYFWIPAERVVTLAFHPPRRPRDLLWRRATMQVADGPDGDVYLPAIYAVDEKEGRRPTAEHRLGRATDWYQAGGEAGPVRGIGARTFLMGQDAVTMAEMTTLAFEGAA